MSSLFSMFNTFYDSNLVWQQIPFIFSVLRSRYVSDVRTKCKKCYIRELRFEITDL